ITPLRTRMIFADSRLVRGALNLHYLLERRAVDPLDVRLRDRAERPHDDRVPAPLRATLLARLGVELARRHLDRLRQGACEHRPAGLAVAVAAVGPRPAASHLPVEHLAEVLADVAVPAVVVRRAEVVAVVVRLVVGLVDARS